MIRRLSTIMFDSFISLEKNTKKSKTYINDVTLATSNVDIPKFENYQTKNLGTPS